jgi:hypothetical protein
MLHRLGDEPQPGIGEIPAGQARIQPPGKADQLSWAVALQGGGHICVIPRLDAAGLPRPGGWHGFLRVLAGQRAVPEIGRR